MKINFAQFKYKIRSWQFISSAIIIVLLVALTIVGLMLLKDYNLGAMMATVIPHNEEPSSSVGIGRLSVESEDDLVQLEGDLVWEAPEAGPSELEEIDDVPTPGRFVDQDAYREQAATGEGLTHLARRALSKYLEDAGEDLLPAERIYAEDYIQLRIPMGGMRWLEVGQEIEINRTLIEEAVQKTSQLTSDQLNNLQFYANQVF